MKIPIGVHHFPLKKITKHVIKNFSWKLKEGAKIQSSITILQVNVDKKLGKSILKSNIFLFSKLEMLNNWSNIFKK